MRMVRKRFSYGLGFWVLGLGFSAAGLSEFFCVLALMVSLQVIGLEGCLRCRGGNFPTLGSEDHREK